MATSDPKCLRLFDAFEVLTWADIFEASSEQGYVVQIQDRGYEPDRVKVRTSKGFVHDVKTAQLNIDEGRLEFIGQYARRGLLMLEIDAQIFITTRPDLSKPEQRPIRVEQNELDELRRAIKLDIAAAAKKSLRELSQYMRRLVGFCTSWNAGNTAKLADITRDLRRNKVGPWLSKIADCLFHCLPAFQKFYLSRKNLASASELLEKAKGTRFQRGMEENLGRDVSQLISVSIEENRLKAAAELADMIPNAASKNATIDQIRRLKKELPAKLDRDFCAAMEDQDIDTAYSVIRTADRESIAKLDSIDIHILKFWLDSLSSYPSEKFKKGAKDLLSTSLNKNSPKAITAIFRNRAELQILRFLKSSDFPGAEKALQNVVADLPLIEKGSSHWQRLRSEFVQQLGNLRNTSEIGKPGAEAAFRKLAEASDLFPLFDLNRSWLSDLVDSQVNELTGFLRCDNAEPSTALDMLAELAPLSDYYPTDFPVSKLHTLLRAAASGEPRCAIKEAQNLDPSKIPVDQIRLQAIRKAADRCVEMLTCDDYSRAKTFYLKHASDFHSRPEIRAELVSKVSLCRRRRELQLFESEIKNACHLICSKLDAFECSQPGLSHIDYQVIAAWNHIPLEDLGETPLGSLLRRLSEYQLMQHIAARSAEKSALIVYERLYGYVSDVSAEQIEGTSEDWVHADLVTRSGDDRKRHIDVKSARSSFARNDRYSEFCVKAFKKTKHGAGVDLSAFFSEYKTADQFFAGATPSYLWLGELSKDRSNRSIDFIRLKFGSIFSLDDFERNFESHRFMPGWIFDFPEPVYKSRNDQIRSLRELIGRAYRRGAIPDNLPLPTLALSTLPLSMEQSRSKALIMNALRCMIQEQGLDRGLLFMTIIAVCLTAIRRGWKDFRPSDFREFLELDDSGASHLRPLGILDPLGYIDELIDCLDIIFERSSDEILRFRTFRLVGHGILQGKSTDDPHWTTILAYCGGRDQKLNVRCGNTPLVLGVHESCSLCRKLVCGRCGFCTDGCENCYCHETEDDISRGPIRTFETYDSNDADNSDLDIPF